MKQHEHDPLVEKAILADLFILGICLKLTQKSLLKEGNDLIDNKC